ncbi:DBR1-domain-containing protein [Ceratobasidium sp. AG-I]|nr:DBR1-domain-containing protein [Ceratobasidium sp. AG-I]
MALRPTLPRLRTTSARQLRRKLRQGIMKVAVAGCCHGELDATYKQIHDLETQNNYKVDLVLINGDFQAMRNHQDLQCMAVPDKYKQLGTFYKYYTGEVTAPVLTIIIGGNHEASNYMWELYHGGWLAPNMYYLGGSGCVKFGGLRIAGASGIYKSHDYRLGHHERLPYEKSNIRSAYHTRLYDVVKLRQLSSPDVFMSHDWPVEITKYGNLESLLKRKPFFRADVEKGELGSPPMMDLLRSLRPAYWFSAHLHCKFEAVVHHEPEAGGAPPAAAPALGQTSVVPSDAQNLLSGGTADAPVPVNPDEIQLDDLDEPADEAYAPPPATAPVAEPEPASALIHNPDEILIEDEIDDSVGAPTQVSASTSTSAPPQGGLAVGTEAAHTGEQSQSRHSTHFLALDKCLPRRPYMHVLDITPSSAAPLASPPKLTYDREWLAISRALHPFLSTTRQQPPLPPPWDMAPLISESQRWVDEHVGEREIAHVQQFAITAPGPINTNQRPPRNLQQPPWYTNPQTEAFCEMLGLENKVNPPPT